MQLTSTMRAITRILCLMKMFCETVLTSEEIGRTAGEVLAAALMDPIMLTHAATHQMFEKSPKKCSKLVRPGTPCLLSTLRLSPLDVKPPGKKNKMKKRNRVNVLLENPTIPLKLEPLQTNREKKSSWGSPNSGSSSLINIDEFHEQIEAAITSSHYEAVSYLSRRREMTKLHSDVLMNLLSVSFCSLRLSRSSSDIFIDLFTEIVGRIVPKYYPRMVKNFLSFSLQKMIPKQLLSMALKHVRLLSKEELSDFIKEVEMKYIWDRIDQVGMCKINKFAFVINEIAVNLDRTEDFIETEHVKEVILDDNEKEGLGKTFLRTFNQVQFIYMTINLLVGLKSMNKDFGDELIQNAMERLFDLGRKELSLDTDSIVGFLEPIMKVFLPQITPEQAEPMGRFMRILHSNIKAQDDLPYIPTIMQGIEDIYIYTQQNFVNLVLARLKYHRSSRLTKGQLLVLLNIADSSDMFENGMMIVILGMVNIDPSNISENDLNSLNIRPRILMKGAMTFPRRFEGEICTMQESFKQTESVIWALPDNLFITKEKQYGNEVFPLTDTLMSLPKLFLYRVFGLPLMKFTDVAAGMNELPEMRELIDVANFFLERWCSINYPGSYPIARVTSSSNKL